jgi:hypothetical protein
MFMCCNSARDRCSFWLKEITFRTTGRSASEDCEARKIRPDAPRPSSTSKPEPAQDLAHFREGGGGRGRLHQAMAVEENFQLGLPLRESAHDLGRIDLQPRFLAEANLLID